MYMHHNPHSILRMSIEHYPRKTVVYYCNCLPACMPKKKSNESSKEKHTNLWMPKLRYTLQYYWRWNLKLRKLTQPCCSKLYMRALARSCHTKSNLNWQCLHMWFIKSSRIRSDVWATTAEAAASALATWASALAATASAFAATASATAVSTRSQTFSNSLSCDIKVIHCNRKWIKWVTVEINLK